LKTEYRTKVNKTIMNWMKKSGLVALLAVLSLGSVAVPSYAQQSVRNEPGYVDLDKVGGWSEFLRRDPKIDVSVEGALMKLVAEASRIEDPELADLLQKLRGVFVRGYETPREDMERTRSHANEVGRDLLDAGWSSVIRVRNEREHVQMFARYRGDIVIGMVVLSIKEADNETMFLNIVGAIDPAQIGRIGQKFNIGTVPEWE
jgi:hypothetical protein